MLLCLSVAIPCLWGFPLDGSSSVGSNATKSSISLNNTLATSFKPKVYYDYYILFDVIIVAETFLAYFID